MASDTRERSRASSWWFEVLKLVVPVLIAAGSFYAGMRFSELQAQPRLEPIAGELPQFPAADRFLTIRLKNLSSRQDAVITGIDFVVTNKEFLDRVKSRIPFEAGPPRIRQERFLDTADKLELTTWDWGQDGRSFMFREQANIVVPSGKVIPLRLRIGESQFLKGSWMTGDLTIRYDGGDITIPRVNLFHKDTPIVPDIPPTW